MVKGPHFVPQLVSVQITIATQCLGHFERAILLPTHHEIGKITPPTGVVNETLPHNEKDVESRLILVEVVAHDDDDDDDDDDYYYYHYYYYHYYYYH